MVQPARIPASTLPHLVAVGFRRINKMLQELAPDFADRASVDVLDVGFEQAVSRIRDMQADPTRRPVDVVVSAGSNGAYLRQHLDMPVVLVKVGGFDLMQALAQARRLSHEGTGRIGLVTYEGMAPDLQRFDRLFDFTIAQRSYRTEDEARACVRELQQDGVDVLVGSGVAVDVAEQLGLTGLFLYSMDAVREALADAVEVARAGRIQQAKRERLNTLLAQLSDGVISVDQHERIETLNPAMAQWLGIAPGAWLGRRLSAACPELSLQATLRLGQPELEKIERVRGRQLIVNRMPIVEQGVLTGAVLSAQDPISIQRVDRHLRTRAQSHAASGRYELAQFAGRSEASRQVQAMAQRFGAGVLLALVRQSSTSPELLQFVAERTYRLHRGFDFVLESVLRFDIIRRLASHPNTPARVLEELAEHGMSFPDIRLGLAANPGTPREALKRVALREGPPAVELLLKHPEGQMALLELVQGPPADLERSTLEGWRERLVRLGRLQRLPD